MTNRATWVDQRTMVEVETPSGTRSIAVYEQGDGPTVLLLHGYPSWAGDWEPVVVGLGAGRRTVALDFLGFGWSDKPVDHPYSIHEQADLVEAVARALGVSRTVLVAHDYGTAVAQELLARSDEGTLAFALDGLVFSNGAVYPDLHRPTAVQELLLSESGGELAAAIDHGAFTSGVASLVARPIPDGVLDDMWAAADHEGGSRLMHRLLHYVGDRAEHGDRWVGHLESTSVPLAFVWGLLDPVSGAHVCERIVERLPDAPMTVLEDVGHWPPLEAPEAVVAAIEGLLT